jgi:hypothetical protein
MFLFCSVFEKELSGYFDRSRRHSRQHRRCLCCLFVALGASTAKTSFCTPAKRVATASLSSAHAKKMHLACDTTQNKRVGW